MKELQTNRKVLVFAMYLLLAVARGIPEWATTGDGVKYLIENKYEYTWFEASHECAKRNLSLVAVDTAQKNLELVSLLKNRFGLGLDLWIGGTESTAENSRRKFVWASNGKGFSYANWESGEPNNLGGNQPCVHIWGKTNNYTWADGQWQLKYGYICEETFATNYQKMVASKREIIKELSDNLILYFKKKQKHLDHINDAQRVLLQQINIELEDKLGETKMIIDHLLEEI